MRLVSYNILNGGLGRADPIAEILEANRPDVVAIVEADDTWVTARIARRLKMETVYSQGKAHGVALLSRFPIIESVNYSFLDGRLTNPLTRVLLQLPTGEALGIGVVHLFAHAKLADEQVRLTELGVILGATTAWRRLRIPHLLVGDFNANSPTQTIDLSRCKPNTQAEAQANGGIIPREVVGRILAEGYVDTLYAVHGEKAATMCTFSTHHPGQRVDYAFTFGMERSRLIDAWVETDRLATYASDHYPIGVEIR